MGQQRTRLGKGSGDRLRRLRADAAPRSMEADRAGRVRSEDLPPAWTEVALQDVPRRARARKQRAYAADLEVVPLIEVEPEALVIPCYVVQTFTEEKGALVADMPLDVSSASEAATLALAFKPCKAGVIAFEWSEEMRHGLLVEPYVLASFGRLPEECAAWIRGDAEDKRSPRRKSPVRKKARRRAARPSGSRGASSSPGRDRTPALSQG